MNLTKKNITLSYIRVNKALLQQEELFRTIDIHARDVEKQLIRSNMMTLCPNDVLIKLSESKRHIAPKVLEYFSKEQFNEDSALSTSCALSSIFYHSDDKKGYLLSKHIHNIKPVSSGVFGNVYSVDLDDEENLFIIKVSIREDLTHELSIGLNVTNHMRKYIPNFAYIYGGFNCSFPMMSDDNVINFCSDDSDKVVHVMYENIIPGTTVKDSIQTISVDDLYSAYTQAMLSILMANEHYNFTHYDLHYENVLLRDGGKNTFQIKYIYHGINFYVKASKIATIIDYGMSYYELNGQSFGKENLDIEFITDYSIYNHTNHVWNDIYKLFMYITLQAFSDKRIDIVNRFCLPIHGVFSQSSSKNTALDFTTRDENMSKLYKEAGILAVRHFLLSQEITEQFDKFYTFPKDGNTLLSPMMLLNTIRNNSTILSDEEFQLPYLDCDTCPEFERMLELIYSKHIYNYLDVYNIIVDDKEVPELSDEEYIEIQGKLEELKEKVRAILNEDVSFVEFIEFIDGIGNTNEMLHVDKFADWLFQLTGRYEQLNEAKKDIKIINTIAYNIDEISPISLDTTLRGTFDDVCKILKKLDENSRKIKIFIDKMYRLHTEHGEERRIDRLNMLYDLSKRLSWNLCLDVEF